MFMLPSRIVALATVLFASAAAAQYPTKPIRLLVPFPAGGAADIAARVVAQPMSQALGQTIVIDNRPGADGAIAGDIVVKSPADGYTLFFATSSAISAVPALRKVPPYDPLTQFTPITSIGRLTVFVFVHSSVPAKSIAELIDYARANPGKLEYGTGHTTGIVATAQFKSLTKTNMLHVPYKGDGPALADLVQGRIKVIFATPTGVLGHVKEGRVRVLATLLDSRSPLLPDAPTMAESGLPKFNVAAWAGMFGPAGLPKDVVERISREANIALKQPAVIEQLARQGFMPVGSNPDGFAAYIKEQHVAWGQAIKDAGIKPD